MPALRPPLVEPEVVNSFASHLDGFASSLPPEDRIVLAALVEAALEPIERMRRRRAAEILSDEEKSILDRLLADQRR